MRRRGLALTGLAMIAAGGIWAAVALASSTVQVDGLKGTDSVEIKEAKADVEDERYNLPEGRKPVTGYSLEKVLNQVDIGDAAWTRVFVPTPRGTIEVRRDEVFSGERLPVFALPKNGDDVFFIRPKKGSRPAVIGRANNLRMNYRVPVEIEPELDDPETGETVKFRADAPGPNDQYDFEWETSSGSTGTGPTFEFTFPSSPGRVQINVEAEKGGQIVAEQTIGTPVKAPPEENTGGSGFGGSSGSFGSGFGSDFSTPNYSPNFPNPGDSSPNFPDDTSKTPDPDEAPPIEETGTSVTGELLSATAPLPPSSGDARGAEAKPEPEPKEAAEEAKEVSAPGALIAAGVIVGLLGLGAGREMENVRPRRFLRRPDLSGLRRLSPPWK